MRETNCLNLKDKGTACKVLDVEQCPKNCFAKMTDPVELIIRLQEMILVNSSTNQEKVAEWRKEIDYLKQKYFVTNDEINPGYEGWRKIYFESLKRPAGAKGGASEANTNPSKPRTTNNKVIETRLTEAERKEVYEKTKEWEKEHGPLEKLSRSSLTRNKVDSYTGEPIE